MKIYCDDRTLILRSMVETDIKNLTDGFAEQNWHKPESLFHEYFKQQQANDRYVIVAELGGQVAGYVTLLEKTAKGPYAGMPEIVDFNVLIKFQRNGIGTKIMDAVEKIALEECGSSCVTLSVGMHSGYGTAQRMYVKRGYIPDGTGLWYNGSQLGQYVECVNDDDLTLYMKKDFK